MVATIKIGKSLENSGKPDQKIFLLNIPGAMPVKQL